MAVRNIPDNATPRSTNLLKPLPSKAELCSLLTCVPETGLLFWKKRPLCRFANNNAGSIWNSRFAGKEALIGVSYCGYRQGRIDGVQYFAHRIIWKMVFGTDPAEIDHINGNRSDNRIANLRSVSRTQNKRNSKRNRNNTSGVTGVAWRKDMKRWTAIIGVGYYNKYLGSFKNKEDAITARTKASKLYGFHQNHGS